MATDLYMANLAGTKKSTFKIAGVNALTDAPSDGTTYGRKNGAWFAFIGSVTSVNGLTGVVVLNAASVGADASGSSAAVNATLSAHTALTTSAHGGIVASTDPRLTDARTPTAHSTSHKHGGTDEVATATPAANAIPKANGSALLDSWVSSGAIAATPSLRALSNTSTTACAGNDSRLSDTRTPTDATVTLAKFAPLAANSIIGNNTGSSATPIAMTTAQTKTLLAIVPGDISGLAAIASSGSASDLSAGTLPAARMVALTGDVTNTAGTIATTIAPAAVTLAKMANLAANSILGNNTGSPATPIALTGTQTTALLTAFVGDTGTGGAKGLVPAPAAGDAAALKVLGAGGTWVTRSAAWGSITGTLSAQSDLQSALDLKAGLSTNTFTGLQTHDLGTGALPTIITATSSARFANADSTSNTIEAVSFAATSLQIRCRAAGGTRAVPLTTTLAQQFFSLVGSGHNGSAYVTSNQISYIARAASAWTAATNYETEHLWQGTPNASTTLATWMTLNNGYLGIGAAPTVGNGYLQLAGTGKINGLALNSDIFLYRTGSAAYALEGAGSFNGMHTIDLGTGSMPGFVPSTIGTHQKYISTDASNVNISGITFGNGNGFLVYGQSVGGTRAAPVVTPTAVGIIGLAGRNYDGSALGTAGAITLINDGATSGANRGTYWTVSQCDNGSTSTSEALRVQNHIVSIGLGAPVIGNGLLQILIGTTKANGIGWDAATNLYPTATGFLKTDAALAIAGNSAASLPALGISGTWFTGGSSTTTKPQLFVESSAVTISTNWSTNGTGIGANCAAAFTGFLIDLQKNGTTQFRASAAGDVDCAGAIGSLGQNNSGAATFSYSPLVSTSALKFTGTIFTGGTATTTKPHLLIEPTGTTSTAWSTAGTAIAANAATGFVGNLLDLQLNGVSRVSIDSTGKLILAVAGAGLSVKEGSNATSGTAVLVGGTLVVSTTKVTATSRIQLTSQVDGGTPGFLRVSARTGATSFTILSSSGTDTSTVAWFIVEPAP